MFMARGSIVETGDPKAFLTAPHTGRARQFLLLYAPEEAPR